MAKPPSRPATKTASSKQFKVPRHLRGAKDAPLPRRVEAKLATPARVAPEGQQWFHEIKFDGYRMFCYIDGGKVQFVSRNQKDWTGRLGSLASVAAKLPVDQAIIDGEVVTFRPDGITDFQLLQNAFSAGGGAELAFYVFDLLYLNGSDLRSVALEERKKLLLQVVSVATGQTAIRYSEHVEGHGAEFFAQASKMGLEGIVSKLRDRAYTAGRDTDWLKLKTSHREEFVIGAFTDPGARAGFGALLLGYHDEKHQLKYAGKVGTGFSDKFLISLRARLDLMVQQESPFTDLQRTTGEGRGAHWVKPDLVAQIAFGEWTQGGHLRHPSFLGLREDKPASSVVRDKELTTSERFDDIRHPREKVKAELKSPPAASQLKPSGTGAEGTIAGVRVTSPGKVLFGDGDITKRELAEYYLGVAHWMLPHVSNRPISLVRCPEGADKECFFQKHPGVGTPKDIRLIPVKEKDATRNYLVIDKVQDLVALAQIGALEIHVWGSQADKLEFPDRMIFDLDPDPTVAWPQVVESAHQIRQFLHEIGLECFVKTTGGKGLHIVVPLQKRQDWDEVKAFSKLVAELIEQAAPNRYTSNMAKASRVGKIFVDYLRNGRTATAICAYSTRAKPQATVSVPLSWDEVTPQIHSDTYTVRNLMERLDSLKNDPWAKIRSVRQSLTMTMKKKLGYKER